MANDSNEIDLSSLQNRSILIVDDNHSMHRDYQVVLSPDPHEGEQDELERLEAFLLGDETDEEAKSRSRNFALQTASQGKEAYELVKKHLAKGIRYPLAFVDQRMPPGWNGLETIVKLQEVDPDMRFVIVTAYSDYSEEELREEIGTDNLVEIVYKPFDPSELYRLAYDIVSGWNRAQSYLARAPQP